jgi:molecular chaperone GrpE
MTEDKVIQASEDIEQLKKGEVKPDKEDPSFAKASEGELKALQLKCEEYLNGWKRERADFVNYKKDEMERIGQLAKYANEELILKIIPILDNIYLAETHIPPELEKHEWIKGFQQIKNQLVEFLSKEGVEPLKSLYEKFDPNYMEVIEEVEAREAPQDKEGWKGEESGIVVEVAQNGYMMHGQVIRVAKVKVTK